MRMRKITVTIIKKHPASIYSGKVTDWHEEDQSVYNVSIQVGAMGTRIRKSQKPDDAPSKYVSGMTVGEAREHRKQSGGFHTPYEFEPMISLDQAFAEAGRHIAQEIRHPDLREYFQPVYRVVDEHNYNNDTDLSSLQWLFSWFKKPQENVDISYRNLSLDELNEIQVGDVVTVSRGYIDFPMLRIKKRGGKLGFVSKHMGDYFGRKKFVALEDLHADYGFFLSSAQRRVETPVAGFERRKKELTSERLAKPGTLTSLHDAEQSLQAVYDYFDNRVKNGDILLDQWMADGYQYSKEAVEAIKKTRESIHGED